jgi:hypothetical protein
VAEARTGIALAGTALDHEAIEGKDYWFDSAASPTFDAGMAHLLPNFDEYTVAYRDRAAALHADRPFDPAFFSFGSILANVVTVGGKVRGAWRRTSARTGVNVEVRALDRFEPAEMVAIEEACLRLGRFLARPVELILHSGAIRRKSPTVERRSPQRKSL